MGQPILYGPAYSTYTRTVRLTLAEKAVAYRLEEVDALSGANRLPDYLARNPFGTVPTLDHDGFVIYETGAITRYIDRVFSGPRLQPQDLRQRARMDQIISIVDAQVYESIMMRLVMQRLIAPLTGSKPDESVIAAALPKVRLCLGELERFATAQTWLAGPALSLADLHLAPIFAYLTMTAESQPLLAPYPSLRKWWTAIAVRDSMRRTEPRFD